MKRLRNFSDIVVFVSGVLLAILEKGEVIEGNPNLDTGTVSAGYQNFIICVEMFFASVALRYAFPYQIYGGDFNVSGPGRSVTMQSISSSLKVTKWFTVYRVCSWILVEYSVEVWNTYLGVYAQDLFQISLCIPSSFSQFSILFFGLDLIDL